MCTPVTRLSATWHLTAAQESHLRSWAARQAARVAGVTKSPDEVAGVTVLEEVAPRRGHKLLVRFDDDLVRLCKREDVEKPCVAVVLHTLVVRQPARSVERVR